MNVPDGLRRSLSRRLDFLADVATRSGGRLELAADRAGGYRAMILPRDGAAVVGAGPTVSRATLELLADLERRQERAAQARTPRVR